MVRAGELGELEVGLHRVQRGVYEVVLRLVDPQSDAEVAPVRGLAAIAVDELQGLQTMPERYGRTLAAQVFADPAVRLLYAKARVVMDRAGLRLRIAIDASALELHELRWELLRDPESDAALATSERVLLSRFMRSQDWRRVRLQARASLRAVIAVAAPTNCEEYSLAPIDRDAEIRRAREALAGIAVTVVGEPCTLDGLLAALRAGADIVYLMCHGALGRQSESVVFLQDEAGAVAPVRGMALAGRIGELTTPPRLMVLASCDSAKRAEVSLAPLLADAGVSAVLAMQGQIGIDTARLLMPRFFAELKVDGQIDRALAVARGAVRERSDAWMPALFLRLKSGQLWYEPRFTGGEDAPSQWKALCQCILRGNFLPIVGPDVDEGLFGGMHALATRLAAEHAYPNAEHERADLAKVAQYINVAQDRVFAHKAVQAGLVHEIVARQDVQAAELPRLLDAVAARRAGQDADPYQLLARLPARIYVTASPETLLIKTIKAAGKGPEALVCRWRATRTNTPQEPRPRQAPTPEAPLVYHVFGAFGVPESLVLTEDDFLDFLIATSTYKLMPAVVRGSLTDSALIFLGFRLDDWTFRVLFRLIMNLEGSAGMRKYSHVGVQVNPEEHSLADVERARRYLERYFNSDRGAGLSEPPISLYWGSPTEFLQELHRRLADTRAEEVAAPVERTDEWF